MIQMNNESIKRNFNPEELVQAWTTMWNSYNLSLVDQLFLADSRVTYFSSEFEGLITGIKALRDHHKGFGFVEGGKENPNKLWVEDLHTTVYDSSAIINGIWFFRKGATDSNKPQRGPVTIIYVLTENGYKIAHMHFAHYK